MSLQRTRLTEVAFVADSVTAIYTNPTSTKTFVRGVLIHNENTIDETVLIHWVSESGTATDGNRIFKLDLESNETLMLEFPFSIVLIDEGETLQAETTTASKVTVAVFGDIDT